MNLLFLIIVICLFLTGLGITLYSWRKKKISALTLSNPSDSVVNSNNNMFVNENGGILELLPKVIALSSHEVLDSEKMHEIRNTEVLAKIDAVIPQLVHSIYDGVNKKKFENINKLLYGESLYKVVIPPGAKLYKAKDAPGAFRGGYSINGRLAGQAHLVKVNPNIQSLARAGELVANVMNVSSVVVGQYYMAEVDAKLEELQNSLDKVIEFQQTEFRAKILSLISKVGKITKFNVEIIENDENRRRNLDSLARYEDEAVELLQQVNLSIDNLRTSNLKVGYKKYKEVIFDIEKLMIFQQYLKSIMEEIARLTYLLNGGKVSSEYCYSMLGDYLKQSNAVRDELAQWHDTQIKHLGIEIDKSRISKKGLESAIFYLPGLVQNDWKYNKLNKNIAEIIKEQSKDKLDLSNAIDSTFEKELQIIVQDGKYYYLKN